MDKQITPRAGVGSAIALLVLAADCGHRVATPDAPPSPETAHAVDAGPIQSMPTDGSLPAAHPVHGIVSVHDGDACRVLDDGRDVRARLVADAALAAAEIEARAARRGLWADPKPVAPWGVAGR